jgi:CBS domain-containing protein
MSPRSISELVVREPPVLRSTDTVAQAVRLLLEHRLPALPVVDERERYAGIFGEREFFSALFPGYLDQLRATGFLRRSLDEAIDLREGCHTEPVGRFMLTEHVDVRPDFSDTHVAEIFLHHRVLVVPIVDGGRVVGLLTRSEFFRALGERFLAER